MIDLVAKWWNERQVYGQNNNQRLVERRIAIAEAPCVQMKGSSSEAQARVMHLSRVRDEVRGFCTTLHRNNNVGRGSDLFTTAASA